MGRARHGVAAHAAGRDARIGGGHARDRSHVDFWTVIFEARCSNIDAYFEAISTPGVRDAMAGYLDLVESGDRRVFRVVAEG